MLGQPGHTSVDIGNVVQILSLVHKIMNFRQHLSQRFLVWKKQPYCLVLLPNPVLFLVNLDSNPQLEYFFWCSSTAFKKSFMVMNSSFACCIIDRFGQSTSRFWFWRGSCSLSFIGGMSEILRWSCGDERGGFSTMRSDKATLIEPSTNSNSNNASLLSFSCDSCGSRFNSEISKLRLSACSLFNDIDSNCIKKI